MNFSPIFLAFSGPSRAVNRICMSLICTCIASYTVECQTKRGKASKKNTPVINDPSRFLLNAMKNREGDRWYGITANALQIDAKWIQITCRFANKSVKSVKRSSGPVNESQIRKVFTEDLKLFDGKVGVFFIHDWWLLGDDKGDMRSATRVRKRTFIIHHVLRMCASRTQNIRQIKAQRFCFYRTIKKTAYRINK